MTPAPEDAEATLVRLSPAVRASLFNSALGTKVEFTAENLTNAVLWRREPSQFTKKQPIATSKATYKKLVEITAPTTDQFQRQLEFLTGYAHLRQDRGAEIISQLGSPVPFFSTLIYMDPARTPYTLELLDAALRFSNYCTMRMKYALSIRRPIEFSPQFQPMIPTPTHGSLPSGHATEAFLVARLLWTILRTATENKRGKPTVDVAWGNMLMRQAARIAVNRTVAGVHFPVDSVAGAILGLTLAGFMHQQCVGGTYSWANFLGELFPAEQDFDWHLLFNVGEDSLKPEAGSKDGAWMESASGDDSCAASPLLGWLWKKAVKEWS